MYERQEPNHEAKTQKEPPAKKELSKYQNQQHKPKSKPAKTPKKTSTTCNTT